MTIIPFPATSGVSAAVNWEFASERTFHSAHHTGLPGTVTHSVGALDGQPMRRQTHRAVSFRSGERARVEVLANPHVFMAPTECELMGKAVPSLQLAVASNGAGGGIADAARPTSQGTVAQKGVRSICGRKERNVPTPRGSVALCDEIDLHGEELVNLIEIVEAVTGDGLVTPDESQLLKVSAVRVRTTFAPLPGHASEQDDALKCIGAIAGAGKVKTRYVRSVIKQAAADTERMAA